MIKRFWLPLVSLTLLTTTFAQSAFAQRSRIEANHLIVPRIDVFGHGALRLDFRIVFDGEYRFLLEEALGASSETEPSGTFDPQQFTIDVYEIEIGNGDVYSVQLKLEPQSDSSDIVFRVNDMALLDSDSLQDDKDDNSGNSGASDGDSDVTQNDSDATGNGSDATDNDGSATENDSDLPVLTLSKAVYAPYESIFVEYQGLPGNSTDWVGTYEAETGDRAYLQYFYTDGRTSGTMAFDGFPAGDYAVRLYYDDSYDLEKEVVFTVSNSAAGDESSASGGTGNIDDTPEYGCLESMPINWTYRSSDGLPIGQSRPGADVTLFVDFDGGSYSDISDNNPVSSFYDADAQRAIEEAIEQTAGNYARWSINVTTDRSVFDSAPRRARMLITWEAGSSGRASTSGISSSSRFTGYVGAETIFDPSSSEKCTYLLTHEFGHNFGLRGTEIDYADSHPNETLGAFMGGRDRQFTGYRWKMLDSKGSSTQYPPDYFEEFAARID